MSTKKVQLRIKRQDALHKPETQRWETFAVDWQPQMNIISALMEIRQNPCTIEKKQVAPVVWECVCLEEVCGACTMVINGRVRQSCTALVDQLSPNGEVITLEPMTKFPLVRDLMVDRSKMFESLKKVKAWIHLDGSHELGPAPRQSPENQEEAYPLSRCMTCGCCVEVCPQYHASSAFVGAAAISQVRLFNLHPSGAMHAGERLDTLMGEGGIQDCGKAQNCVEACPKEIPLVDSIGHVSRDITKRLMTQWINQ